MNSMVSLGILCLLMLCWGSFIKLYKSLAYRVQLPVSCVYGVLTCTNVCVSALTCIFCAFSFSSGCLLCSLPVCFLFYIIIIIYIPVDFLQKEKVWIWREGKWGKMSMELGKGNYYQNFILCEKNLFSTKEK